MSEPTKACVRVLRTENAMLRGLKWFINIPIRILSKCFAILERLCQYINWCIVRAIIRWAGFPFTGYIAYYFVIVRLAGTLGDTDPKVGFGEFFGWSVLLAIMLTITLICWFEVPDKEKAILFKELNT